MHNHACLHAGLTLQERQQLTVTELKEQEGRHQSCAICMEPLVGHVTTLLCEHAFHESCVGQWFSNHRTCPTCRQDAVGSSPGAVEQTNPITDGASASVVPQMPRTAMEEDEGAWQLGV